MKHSLKITVILLIFFLIAQFIGIGIVYKYIDLEKSTSEKKVFKDLPFGERPPLDEKTSYISVIISILIGTGLALLLLKYNLVFLLRFWFLLAIIISLTVAFAALLPGIISFAIALGVGLWKILKPNFWIQNLTELIMYGGLAAIFVPVFNLWSVSILIILIAIYDAYAVWKSKHMITLATSQAKAKIFAGLLIPYSLKTNKKIPTTDSNSHRIPQKVRTAVLGGGDIAFPLIFAGVVLKELGLWQSLVIPFFAALGLGLLLYFSEEKKFYPAMPFIAAGCFLGLGVIRLLF